jgi:predicted aldo/keto reductase-like oxidoreductase
MKKYSRRKFLQDSAMGVAAVSASGMISSCSVFGSKNNDNKIPKRILGKTGLEVSILSFGGGSQFLKNRDGDWEQLLTKAVESGINLFDTAPSYTLNSFHLEGKESLSSEERYGKILSQYRDRIILSTKLESRNADEVKGAVEKSLKNLNTDYLDIVLIHSIEPSDDVARIENGIYKELMLLKDSGVIKNVGFSSMDSAERSREMLEKLDLDVALLAMNPTKYGDFAEVALPVARKKNVGVMAMKVMRDIVGKEATAKELFEYAWTQEGVATALVGFYGIDILDEDIELAQNFGGEKTVSIDQKELEARLNKYAGPHALCWARPGYKDGGIIV